MCCSSIFPLLCIYFSLSNALGKNIKKYRRINAFNTKQELSDKIVLLGVDIYHSDISQFENQKLLLKDFEIIAILISKLCIVK